MNMELFRYVTVAQLERNAITAGEISNESANLRRNDRFFGVNETVNTLVLMRIYSCWAGECRQCWCWHWGIMLRPCNTRSRPGECHVFFQACSEGQIRDRFL